MSFIIALDGPTASGKGTLGKKLAAHFSLRYLDTGLLYRAVAYRVLKAEKDPSEAEIATHFAQNLDPDLLNDEALRREDVGAAASVVSSHEGVRAALLAMQRDFAHTVHPPYQGALLDGRDIGTVICPDAHVKIFITASEEVRAERRFAQLQDSGFKGSYADILAALKERDARDRMRLCSPLAAASDAIVVDTSNLGIDEVLSVLIGEIAPRLSAYFHGENKAKC